MACCYHGLDGQGRGISIGSPARGIEAAVGLLLGCQPVRRGLGNLLPQGSLGQHGPHLIGQAEAIPAGARVVAGSHYRGQVEPAKRAGVLIGADGCQGELGGRGGAIGGVNGSLGGQIVNNRGAFCHVPGAWIASGSHDCEESVYGRACGGAKGSLETAIDLLLRFQPGQRSLNGGDLIGEVHRCGLLGCDGNRQEYQARDQGERYDLQEPDVFHGISLLK